MYGIQQHDGGDILAEVPRDSLSVGTAERVAHEDERRRNRQGIEQPGELAGDLLHGSRQRHNAAPAGAGAVVQNRGQVAAELCAQRRELKPHRARARQKNNGCAA